MTDDPTRTALQIALQAAVRDRDRALATISFLTEKLGLPEPGATAILMGPGTDNEGDAEGARDVGPVPVTEGEWYGMSQPKAAVAFLERAGRGRPQRTEAIIAALKKGGVEFGGKDPATSFYTILARKPEFRNIGKSTWGLSAWYPPAPKKQPKAAGTPAAPAEDTAAGGDQTTDPPAPSEQTAQEDAPSETT